MASRRSIVRYCLFAGVVTFSGCVTDITGFEAEATGTAATTDSPSATSVVEATSGDTTSTEASPPETSSCGTPTTDHDGTDVFVANRRSTAERLSVSAYRATDGEGERIFSKTYSLSGEERARSDDVIIDSGRYRVEASTADGVIATLETALPDENDAPLDHYSLDVTVTESENVETGLSIADVGTPTVFGDGC